MRLARTFPVVRLWLSAVPIPLCTTPSSSPPPQNRASRDKETAVGRANYTKQIREYATFIRKRRTWTRTNLKNRLPVACPLDFGEARLGAS